MKDIISPEDRAAIDAAVATGRVRRVPQGAVGDRDTSNDPFVQSRDRYQRSRAKKAEEVAAKIEALKHQYGG